MGFTVIIHCSGHFYQKARYLYFDHFTEALVRRKLPFICVRETGDLMAQTELVNTKWLLRNHSTERKAVYNLLSVTRDLILGRRCTQH